MESPVLELIPLRRRVTLTVLTRNGTSSIVVPPGPGGGPAYRGPGPADYLCGECGAVLCDGVSLGMFNALAFACRCGALNGLR
jgi:hypothetical protein